MPECANEHPLPSPRSFGLPLATQPLCFSDLSGRHLSGDLISIPDCGLRGLGIAACPGEAVPLMRLNIIARDTLAIVIHKTEIDLRSGVSLLGGQAPPFDGLL